MQASTRVCRSPSRAYPTLRVNRDRPTIRFERDAPVLVGPIERQAGERLQRCEGLRTRVPVVVVHADLYDGDPWAEDTELVREPRVNRPVMRDLQHLHSSQRKA